MKKAACLLLLLSFAVFGQEKPLTQAEYVKMLYSYQKNPGTKTDILDALRKRGVDFEVNDGVLGLTRSKTANDEDIRSALEEAVRSRRPTLINAIIDERAGTESGRITSLNPTAKSK